MSTILVGSAPDSWACGSLTIRTNPYTRFLDEVAASGYQWIELGPFGYLPTDPTQLSDELAGPQPEVGLRARVRHLHQDELLR